MSEQSNKDQTLLWVGLVVAGIAIAGCCLVAALLILGVGAVVPVRSVAVSQVSPGPRLATPTPIILLPPDTLPPLSTITPTPLEGFPTARPTATLPTAEAPGIVPAGAQTGIVVNIIDGDTIDVNIGGQVFRVRYIGIDTPETGETCGSEATAANRALVDGHQVTMVKDTSETDRYDRLLRYVYVGETFVNAELVRNGWAEAVVYPPDTQFADMFRELQDQARADNVGCWPMGAWVEVP